MRVHRQAAPRYRCPTGGQPCAATKDTPCDRVRTAAEVVTRVLTLRSHGCPTQAIVAAFGVDARTVAAGLTRAGQPCERVQQHVVPQGRVDWPPVQADELWVKLVGRRAWMALALAVPSRRWLGGVRRPQRDLVLSTRLMPRVGAGARTLAILVGVDGLASSLTTWLRGFRHPGHTGRPGRPRLVWEQGGLLGHLGTRDVQRRVSSGERRVVRGTSAASAAVLAATGGGTGSNTAAIEPLNATFRASLAPLVCRGRARAPTEALLTAGMGLVGCADNCCWLHERWRVAAPRGAPWQGQAHTPAMAAGPTHHRWTMPARWRSQGPLPAWVAPQRRGRPPTRDSQPAMAVAA